MSQPTTHSDEIKALLESARGLLRAGSVSRAEVVCDRVLGRQPDHAEALRLKGVCYFENGDVQSSLQAFEAILLKSPNNASVYNNIGSVHHALKDYSQAVVAYKKALSLEPASAHAANNLGNTYQALGRHEDAIELYRQALSSSPNLAQIHNNLGNALSSTGLADLAISSFNRALELKPDYPDAWNNLGICSSQLGLNEDAIAAYDKALELNSDFCSALNNKGNLLLSINQTAQAQRCYEKAVALNRDFTEAWNGLGNALRASGRLTGAVNAYRTAIAASGDYAEAWNNLGLTFADQGLLDNAINAFRAALKIKPGYWQCHSNLLLFLNYQPSLDEKSLASEHLDWARAHKKEPMPARRARLSGNRRLRIAYVSADFARHPVSYFILPVLENHDRSNFSIYCYSNSFTQDDVTEKVRRRCEHWRNIHNVGDTAVAELIREDGIDVLFDLSGHTRGNRLPLFSLDPAPVQISWLGYPHTSGLERMDYVLSDEVNLPRRLHALYTERVAILESRCCYQPPDYAPDVTAPPALKNGRLNFGSFSNPVKINDQIISLWSRVLLAVKNSKLVLSWKSLDDPSIANRLLDMFGKHDIDACRIELIGGARKHEQVFADYNDIDIALDTYPFSGGLTSCEALWMGVPVITLAGDRPASRQTAGFLTSLNLDELIASSTDAFIENATQLAEDQERLVAIRCSLRDRMLGSAFCNGELFTRQFEQTLLGLAQSHDHG